MKYLKNYKLFELVDTENETKSKSQLKRELWHKNNPDPKGTNLNVDELDKFGIPQGIKDMMSEWSIIHKSPYSKSFYSSDNISWTVRFNTLYTDETITKEVGTLEVSYLMSGLTLNKKLPISSNLEG